MSFKQLLRVSLWAVLFGILLSSSAIAGGKKEAAGGTSGSQASEVQLKTDSSGYVEPSWPATYAKDTKLTFWTWITNADKWSALFMKAYPTITVDTQNVGQGQPQYTKLLTAIQAGSGAPDVVLIELQFLPQFINTGGLADISKYCGGFGKLYPEWVWSQVNYRGKLYAIPEDIGPMGMFYRKDLFDKYNIAFPKTWDDYAKAAEKLHAADPNVAMSFFEMNDGGWILASMWQSGVFPFKDTPQGWVINFTSPEAKRFLTYWDGLVKKGYVRAVGAWTPEWSADLAAGKYATVLGAAWSPTYELEPYIKDASQQWRAEALPNWDPNHKVNSNWGGSTNAVTTQCKNPEAAALFAAWLDLSRTGVEFAATDVGQGGAGLFPAALHYDKIKSFAAPNAFLGGQKSNLLFESLSPLVDKSFQFSPWSSYVYNELNVEFAKLFDGKQTVDQTLAAVQKNVTDFAKAQGFQVAP